jgi:anti-anti-sigma factor
MNAQPELQIDYHDAVPVARLGGDIDIVYVPGLRERLLTAIRNHDLGLVIDLTQVRYIDSAAINVLFELAERLGTRQLRLALVVPADGLVDRVLSIVDVAAVATVQRSLDAALEAVRGDGHPA